MRGKYVRNMKIYILKEEGKGKVNRGWLERDEKTEREPGGGDQTGIAERGGKIRAGKRRERRGSMTQMKPGRREMQSLGKGRGRDNTK